jgi:hypothetical protein
MDQENQGPSGVKDLGGLLNKDIAFSKVPENVVYESKNFRVTTDDGGTLAVRSNIKGNTSIISIPNVPCTKALVFDLNKVGNRLTVSQQYTLEFFINGGGPINFVFTYSSINTFLNDVITFINTNPTFTSAFITAAPTYSTQGVFSTNYSTTYTGTIVLSLVNCETVSTGNFYSGTTASSFTNLGYSPVDEECVNLISSDPTLPDYNTNLNKLPLGNSGYIGTVGPNQWQLDNQWIGTSVTTPNYTINLGTNIVNAAGAPLHGASTVTRIRYQDSYTSLLLARNASAALISYDTLGGTIYNLEDYPTGPYNFDLSYYVGALNNANVTFTLKVYMYMGNGWNDPSLTYEFPTIPTAFQLNGSLRCARVYSQVLSQNLNKLSLNSNNETFTVNLSDTPYNNGATTKPQLIVFIEASVPASTPYTYSIDFNLDYLKVAGPVINPNLVVVNDLSVGATNPLLIGWVSLRDSYDDNLYLFTTTGKVDPDDPTTWGGPNLPVTDGQIWKLHYDKAGDYTDTTNYNLSLIYSNSALNFTVYRPIANPGMIEGRYENEFIQKIYWTDNYNVPRQINVADPNVASLTLEQLRLLPSLSMDLPQVTEVIDGGGLYMGVYQVAYRLKNTNGSETRFSRTSQLIPIIDASENVTATNTYYPTKPLLDNTNTNDPKPTVAGKSIRVEVQNVDTNFDTIEFVTLYYRDNTSTPEINIVREVAIPADGSVDLVISGNEDKVPITLDEFTAFTAAIIRAKTLAAKKQTLFLGNVALGTQIVNWDARAYRFPRNSTTTVIKDVINNSSYTVDSSTYKITQENGIAVTTPYLVPEEHDSVQDYASQAPTLDTNYLYQANSNVLGGSGPNVSYEFVTETTLLDNKNDQASFTFAPHSTPATNTGTTFWSEDRYYASRGNSLSNNNSPYKYDIFVGYRRDEMERFGIVFFDELDNPTYVNWIGDIRMPHMFMPDTTDGAVYTGSGNGRSTIDSSNLHTNIVKLDTTNNYLYGKPLGIRFTIDFSNVPSQYKKASIVRVPKKQEDKHILAQGLFVTTVKTEGVAPFPQEVYLCNPAITNSYNYYDSVNNENWFDCWTFHSPDFLFDKFLGYGGTDAIDVLGLYKTVSDTWLADEYSGAPVALNGTYILDSKGSHDITAYGVRNKIYDLNESITFPATIKNTDTLNPYPIQKATVVNAGGDNRRYDTGITADYSGGTIRSVHNCGPKDLSSSHGGGIGSSGTAYSYGNNSLFVELQENPASNWNNTLYGGDGFLGEQYSLNPPFPGSPIASHYLANYTRAIQGGPFGGHGYFARSLSEYIPCNNLIDISSHGVISTRIFGGDTAVTILDHVLQFYDRAEGVAFLNNSDSADLLTHWVYFPCETYVAIDYRRNYNNTTSLLYTGVPNRSRTTEAPGGLNWTGVRIGSSEYFNVDNVYNHTDKTAYTYFAKPALGDISLRFDCRVWKSEPKQDGELVESWSNFKPGAYLDVESAYGPLNNLIVFKDKLYYFQDRAFGQLQVNEQKLIQPADETAANLVLGSSGILERYDYISTKTGTKHQFGMSVSDYSMIWFDTLARKMYRYKGEGLEPLSDIKGLNAFLYNRISGNIQVKDNPYIYEGIHCTYDFRHNEFYMTFLDKTSDFYLTLVYNDLLDGYIGEYTHYPKVYLNDKLNIFSPDPDDLYNETLYIHNYGRYANFYQSRLPDYSTLSFILNTSSTTEKVLHNLEFVTEAFSTNTQQAPSDSHYYDPLAQIDYTDFFESMRIFDNYQNTDWINLIPNTTDLSSRDNYARRHKTIWNVRVPSDRVLDVNQNIFDNLNLSAVRPRLTRRLKDKWFMVELTYNNTPNNKLVVHSAKATYALNSR